MTDKQQTEPKMEPRTGWNLDALNDDTLYRAAQISRLTGISATTINRMRESKQYRLKPSAYSSKLFYGRDVKAAVRHREEKNLAILQKRAAEARAARARQLRDHRVS